MAFGPATIMIAATKQPPLLASASDAADLARHGILADAVNLGKPTDLDQLLHMLRSIEG